MNGFVVGTGNSGFTPESLLSSAVTCRKCIRSCVLSWVKQTTGPVRVRVPYVLDLLHATRTHKGVLATFVYEKSKIKRGLSRRLVGVLKRS